MAQHLWTLVCSHVIVNGLTNNISLIDVVEELTIVVPPSVDPAVGFPAGNLVPVTLNTVSAFQRTDPHVPERLIGRLSLVGPSGRTQDNNFDIDLSSHVRARCIAEQHGLPIQEPGDYVFAVFVEQPNGSFDEVARVSLRVILTH
jgi:hypothetical protein